MRVPSAEVRRRPLGLRGWLIGAAVLLIILLLSLRGLARFYTDYLWFKDVGFEETWRGLLAAKAIPALIFSAVFFVAMFVDLTVADRIAPRYRATGPEDEIIERYRSYVAPYAGRVRVIVALFFAIVMGSGVSTEWRNWILFSHSVDFGVKDPQFHKDIGFYVFRLPFLKFVSGWVFAALLVVLIVTLVFHYLNGGIRLQSPFQRVTPQVKVHISVILALMALTKTVQYYLARFELTVSHRGFVDGATYTDVKAQLPALNLLMLISVAAAILFIANIFRRGWVFPIIAVGLWGFISIVVGTIYPAVIQRFVVQPNELTREQPYIKRNIHATRTAFGLDKIDVQTYRYGNVTPADVATPASQATLANVRLWDPVPLQAVLRANQEFQPFYGFGSVAVDRYKIGDDPRQPALVSVRELDASNLPDKSWTNQHLVYTHGYGVVAAAANNVEGDQPDYLLSGVPVSGDLKLAQPGVYFGEGFSSYAVVGTKVDEQEASATGNRKTRYSGNAGVETSSFIRKAALALRFGDWNLFVSGQLTGKSRILYLRDIRERVSTAAPFLRFDADPYPVVYKGRVVWILDAYTTTSRYPYSQSIHPQDLPQGSGLDTDFNYVRNSVKATVDAYDGTIHFYVVDPKDPIIRAYRKAFPRMFEDAAKMPALLREHWRYPEDIFRAQTEQLTLYHMIDSAEFFRKQTLWDIAPSPEGVTAATVSETSGVGGNNGGRSTTLPSSGNPIDPLYLTMQLPGDRGQEFVLMRAFVPRRKGNQLASFMVARNDGADYGKLTVFQLPVDSVAPSPVKAAGAIESDENISSRFSLLDQLGSKIVRGDVQLIPIGGSIFYVRPIYVEGKTTAPFPRYRFVAITVGDRAVLRDSLTEAVQAVLNPQAPSVVTTPGTLPGGSTTSTSTPTTTPSTLPTNATVGEQLAKAEQELAAADDALRRGDLGAYQQHVSAARQAVEAALALQGGSAPTTSTTGAAVHT